MKERNDLILQTKNLDAGYKKGKATNIVLKGVNLSLHRGELVCFLGPNGVGKSTLLRTISGVQPPIQGEVLIDQQALSSLSLLEKAKRISLVLTGRISGANLTVKELVTLGRHPHTNWAGTLTKEDYEKTEAAITNTHIEALVDQKLYALSDGQLQKAMIARALAQDSDIMILDEPTAHLDLNNRIEIMDLLLNMAKKTNKAILAATHELDLAFQTADKFWLAGFDQPIISGIPEALALNGFIEKIFFRPGIHFNPFTGRFSLTHTFKRTIKLSGGNALFKHWTSHALQRIGYAVSEVEGEMAIHIKHEAGKAFWQLNVNNDIATYHSLEHLLKALQEK